MSNPFEGWSKIDEDWDAGVPIEVNDLTANVGTFAKNFLGPVAMLFVGIWLVKFLLSAFVTVLYLGAQIGEINVLYKAGGAFSYLSYPIVLLIILCQASLYRPLQLQAFEGKSFVGGFGDAFRLAKDAAGRVALVMLLYLATVMAGTLVCGFGALFATFFFIQAPYLAATTELPPMECMRRSYELSKSYFMPVLAAIVVSGGFVGAMSCIGGFFSGLIGGFIMPTSPGLGYMATTMGSDLFGILGGAITLIFSGAMFTSIQAAELSRPIVRD